MRSEWKQHARQALKGKWWLMAGLALLFCHRQRDSTVVRS